MGEPRLAGTRGVPRVDLVRGLRRALGDGEGCPPGLERPQVEGHGHERAPSRTKQVDAGDVAGVGSVGEGILCRPDPGASTTVVSVPHAIPRITRC